MTVYATENGRRPEDRDFDEHDPVRQETGYWGRRGAGAIIMAKSTGRILIGLRSDEVMEPGTWGTFGGAIPKDMPEPDQLVRQEVREETGADRIDELVPLLEFTDDDVGFRYYNFLAIVSDEFDPVLNWEHDVIEWFDFGDWPDPLHFGLRALLSDEASVETIQRYSEGYSGTHRL